MSVLHFTRLPLFRSLALFFFRLYSKSPELAGWQCGSDGLPSNVYKRKHGPVLANHSIVLIGVKLYRCKKALAVTNRVLLTPLGLGFRRQD